MIRFRDVQLAAQARKLVKASGPADMGSTAASNLGAMMATVLTALDTALSDPSHPVALACAQVVGRYQTRLTDIEWRAYRILNPQPAAVTERQA